MLNYNKDIFMLENIREFEPIYTGIYQGVCRSTNRSKHVNTQKKRQERKRKSNHLKRQRRR